MCGRSGLSAKALAQKVQRPRENGPAGGVKKVVLDFCIGHWGALLEFRYPQTVSFWRLVSVEDSYTSHKRVEIPCRTTRRLGGALAGGVLF